MIVLCGAFKGLPLRLHFSEISGFRKNVIAFFFPQRCLISKGGSAEYLADEGWYLHSSPRGPNVLMFPHSSHLQGWKMLHLSGVKASASRCWLLFDSQWGNQSVLAALSPTPSPPTTTPHHRSHFCLSCPQYDGDCCSISTKTAPICEEWPTLPPAPLFSFRSACLLHRWLAATNIFTSPAYLWVPHFCQENKSKQIKLENLSQ